LNTDFGGNCATSDLVRRSKTHEAAEIRGSFSIPGDCSPESEPGLMFLKFINEFFRRKKKSRLQRITNIHKIEERFSTGVP